MEEKIYKTMKNAGGMNVTLGVQIGRASCRERV